MSNPEQLIGSVASGAVGRTKQKERKEEDIEGRHREGERGCISELLVMAKIKWDIRTFEILK